MTSVEQRTFFAKRLDLELKRAKRYSIFVSMLIFDLSFLTKTDSGFDLAPLEKAASKISKNVREIDNVAVLENSRIGVLLPETSRQGAEITSRRLSEMIRLILVGMSDLAPDELIPVEMVSYPDAAGAKSVDDMLLELFERSRN